MELMNLRQIGRLRTLALVTSLLMTAAAINEALGYALFTLDHPGTSFQQYLPITLVGAVPFLLTATLIILAARGPRTAGGHRSQASAIRLRVVSGFGLLPIAIGGFWSGIGLGFLGIESNSRTAVALFIYQFLFLAAVLADLVLLIVAFRVRSSKEERHG